MRCTSLALPLLLLCSPVAVAAQDAPTAQQNLDCAAVLAIAGGDATDGDEEHAIAMLLSYFMGLYEGQVGKPADDALADRIVQLKPDEIDRLGAECGNRSAAFGDRLEALGKRLNTAGK